jgi:hypothetical protein
MKLIEPGTDGWSEWITPKMAGYHMGCCDCKLVHLIEFKVMQVTGTDADGDPEGYPADPAVFKVQMRVRRDEEGTTELRNEPIVDGSKEWLMRESRKHIMQDMIDQAVEERMPGVCIY